MILGVSVKSVDFTLQSMIFTLHYNAIISVKLQSEVAVTPRKEWNYPSVTRVSNHLLKISSLPRSGSSACNSQPGTSKRNRPMKDVDKSRLLLII